VASGDLPSPASEKARKKVPSEGQQCAAADLKHLLDEVEFIEYRRRDFEAASMVQELLRRGGVVPAAQAKEGVPPQRPEVTTTVAQEEPEPE
jgi:hypothetical protein